VGIAMARGWESKAIEAQQAEASEEKQSGRSRMTAEQAQRSRVREGLLLQQKRLQQQLSHASNPAHRATLEAALAHLNQQLENLKDLSSPAL
jgi:hypothetical protein